MRTPQAIAEISFLYKKPPPSRFVALAAFVPSRPKWSLVIEPLAASLSGNDMEAVVEFLVEEAPHYYLTPGVLFYLHDGTKVVAEGVITEQL